MSAPFTPEPPAPPSSAPAPESRHGGVIPARSDRFWYGAAFVVLVAASWAYLVQQGYEMRQMAAMDMPGDEAWSGAEVGSVFVMWAVMMVAMMLPSALPLLLIHRRLVAVRGSSSVAVAALAAGYLAMWTAFSVLATLAQWYLHERALLSPALATTSRGIAGALLIVAGAYQWMPLKRTCLAHCSSPLRFITMHWRAGIAGAWRMGIVHGAYCIGCCWLLMALLFVGGVMNLAWVAAIAAYIFLEKVLPFNRLVSRIFGLALIAFGVATAFG
jgi:predicted metal-binding membrane protein